MHLYIDEIQISTKIFNLDSTNQYKVKTQKQNCKKSETVLMHNHEADEYLDRYTHVHR
jgi:hypothetical protein